MKILLECINKVDDVIDMACIYSRFNRETVII